MIVRWKRTLNVKRRYEAMEVFFFKLTSWITFDIKQNINNTWIKGKSYNIECPELFSYKVNLDRIYLLQFQFWELISAGTAKVTAKPSFAFLLFIYLFNLLKCTYLFYYSMIKPISKLLSRPPFWQLELNASSYRVQLFYRLSW